MDGYEDEPVEPLPVRATVHLTGLRPGDETLVDPARPYVTECLRAEWLVPLKDEG